MWRRLVVAAVGVVLLAGCSGTVTGTAVDGAAREGASVSGEAPVSGQPGDPLTAAGCALTPAQAADTYNTALQAAFPGAERLSESSLGEVLCDDGLAVVSARYPGGNSAPLVFEDDGGWAYWMTEGRRDEDLRAQFCPRASERQRQWVTANHPGHGYDCAAADGAGRPDGDLGLAVPITVPACDGTGIVVLYSAVVPGQYAQEVQGALERFGGASYLRTDRACPSLRQALDGNPIYAVYRVAGRTTADVCAAVSRAGGDAYGKWLDTSSDPNHVVRC